MIKDVSRQWAMMLESETNEQEKYSAACDEACEQIKQAELDEIENFDEATIDPSECGFNEAEEDHPNALEIWKQLKKNKEPAKSTVKVDQKYIDIMAKLLRGIKSSKKQIYDNVMTKLAEYKKSGIELPPPEDYAENFVPFEQIQKIMGGKEDREDDDENKEEEVGDKDVSLASQASKEYADTLDKYSFGNDMAMQNMYDSELTEDEEEDAKQKAIEALAKAKDSVKASLSEEDVEKWLDENKAKIEKIFAKSSVKDQKVADAFKQLEKILEKYAKGQLDEAKDKTNPPSQLVKAIIRFLNWVLMAAPYIGKGSAWVLNKTCDLTLALQKKIDKGLQESIGLEIADEEEMLEKQDAECLDADGCTEMKEQEEVDEAACKNQDDPATHLLDAIGVKASTASLKAQDTAMISVVEMLMKKIDKLETKLDEAQKLNEYGHQKFDLSNKDGTVSKALKNHIAEWTPQVLKNQQHAAEVIKSWFDEEGVDTPYTQKMLKEIAFLPKFRNVMNIIMYLNNVMQSGMGNKMTYGKNNETEENTESPIPEDEFMNPTNEVEEPTDDELDAIEANPEMIDELPVISDKDVLKTKPEFIGKLEDMSKEDVTAALDRILGKWKASIDALNAHGVTRLPHPQDEVRKALAKMNTYRQMSYDHELTDEQKEEFADLVYNYWYDWYYPDNGSDPRSIADLLNMPFKSYFGRAGNKPLLSKDFIVKDEFGNLVILPNVNTMMDVDDYKQSKSIEKRNQKAKDAAEQAKIDAGNGFKPERGQDTWKTEDWNKMIGVLSKDRKKELMQDMIADIEKSSDDELKKNQDIAMVTYLFSGDKTARIEAAEKARATIKFRKMLQKRLELIHDEVAKKQSELQKTLKDTKAALDKANAELEAHPDDEAIEDAQDEALLAYMDANDAYEDFLHEIEDDIPQTGDKNRDKTILFQYALEQYPLTAEEESELKQILDPSEAKDMIAASGKGKKRGKGREVKMDVIAKSMGYTDHMGLQKAEQRTLDNMNAAFKYATGKNMNLKNQRTFLEDINFLQEDPAVFKKFMDAFAQRNIRKSKNDATAAGPAKAIMDLLNREIEDDSYRM